MPTCPRRLLSGTPPPRPPAPARRTSCCRHPRSRLLRARGRQLPRRPPLHQSPTSAPGRGHARLPPAPASPLPVPVGKPEKRRQGRGSVAELAPGLTSWRTRKTSSMTEHRAADLRIRTDGLIYSGTEMLLESTGKRNLERRHATERFVSASKEQDQQSLVEKKNDFHFISSARALL
ncbi:uncharacterized protein LOC106144048 isoform X2 [Microtus ochrogaster]|uniref:Uncharacterized protein LOC106144048 isoform X2 n=1 Tax=Microtus ochrogaster TaxID=79684 RepID=A0ABM1UDM7_MICOH|nr:uncharacterized protein LOC106144048 isoform X2 [Microtus ochrogaster]